MADKKKSIIPTIILTLISIIWIYPIVMILFNSLKVEQAITTSGVFQLPTSETWNGIKNFVASVTQMDFLKSSAANIAGVLLLSKEFQRFRCFLWAILAMS